MGPNPVDWNLDLMANLASVEDITGCGGEGEDIAGCGVSEHSEEEVEGGGIVATATS
jgi:hypothetical protein